VKFSSTSPYVIHLSSITFAGAALNQPSPACGVGIFTEDRTQTLDVNVPAKGQSAVVTFPGAGIVPGP
jgi:hypothetical protein